MGLTRAVPVWTLDVHFPSLIDVVGCLEAALEGSEVSRGRRQISNQLVKQCLVLDRKQLHCKQSSRKRKVWTPDRRMQAVCSL